MSTRRMDNSTFVVLANGSQVKSATSVSTAHASGTSIQSATGMILVPRPSYSAAVTQRIVPTSQNSVTQVAPNFALKRVPSGGTEIRLIVTNPKDARPPTSVFASSQSLRPGGVATSFNGGIKVQFTGGSIATTVARTTHSVNSSNANSLLTQSNTVHRLAPVQARNTGNVLNSSLWNALSVVDANVTKTVGEPVSSSSDLIIQIGPEQFKQLAMQSVVNGPTHQSAFQSTVSATNSNSLNYGSSVGPSRVNIGTQHLRVATSHQPIQPKLAPAVQLISVPNGSSVMFNRSKTPTQLQPNVSARSGGSVSVVSTNQRRILPAMPPMRHTVSPASAVGLGSYQTIPNAVGLQCNQIANGVVHQTSGALCQTFAYVSQPNYTYVQTPLQTSSSSHLDGPSVDAVIGHEADEYVGSARLPGNWLHESMSVGANTTAVASRPKKPCNCTKSQCLKLYCECFAGGEFCNDCNCTNCFNNLTHEEDRTRAVKACLERNPHAFHPKIGKGGNVRQHCKGCNCKRSGCLKNYCECYEAKIPCSNLCRCVGCKNFEDSPDRQTLLHLADAAEVRVQQQAAAETKFSSHIKPPVRPAPPPAGMERPAYMFINLDVVEAISSCLVAEGERGERELRLDAIQERELISEFGRCLRQVIDSACRTREPTPYDD